MNKASAALVATLGAERQGVVTLDDVIGVGLDPALPRREAAAGRWQRLLPQIYLPGTAAPTERQRIHAAALYAGPEAVITGRAGCALRGVKAIALASADVTVLLPHRVRRVSAEFVRLVRVRDMPEWQVLRREGSADLRVAPIDRCVADAIRGATDLAEARAVAASALRERDVPWDAVAGQASRPGPGAGHGTRAVRDIADGVRSPAEGDLHDVLLPAARRGQLPSYLLNPDVYMNGVLLGSPDAWFVGLGLGDEQDSREWHGSEDALDATLTRHRKTFCVSLPGVGTSS
ncbi:MAG: hypothetical protein M3P04_00310 [Actinomycetota bacterium]|nr:hypothetical protein [Actinomycetota bacterium]